MLSRHHVSIHVDGLAGPTNGHNYNLRIRLRTCLIIVMSGPLEPRDIFLSLLPAGGENLAFAAATAALSEKLHHEVSEDDTQKILFSLQADGLVDWFPEHRQLRRRLENNESELPRKITREQDLEGWFERFLWTNANMFFDPMPPSLSVIVRNTARTQAPGGRWTRPDLCMATVARYRYQPAPEFSMFSFELKMPEGANILAVHEALAHSATTNYAYLGLYLPNGARAAESLGRVCDQAQLHGVGVIRITDPFEESGYQRLLEAQRKSPSSSKTDAFIEERFDLANRLALQRWVRP